MSHQSHSSSQQPITDLAQLQQYTAQLETELKSARAQSQLVYDSIRTGDKLIYRFKKSARPFYRLAKALRRRGRHAQVTPRLVAKSKGELRFIHVNDSPKRLNLVLNMLTVDSLKQPSVAQLVLGAVRQANRQHLALRIITRHALPDPKAFRDFLAAQHLTIPSDCSFYSDSPARLAAPVRRLEIGKHDRFYSVSSISTKEAHAA